MNHKKIGIIGAGIGGLTAGALLAKEGFEITIFEKEKVLGGRALSFDGTTISLDEYNNLLKDFNLSIAFSKPDIKEIFKNKMLKGYKLDLGYHAIGGGVLSNVNSVLSEFDDHIDFLESYVGFIDNNSYRFPFLSKSDKLKIFPKILRLLFASEKTLNRLDKISMSETIEKYGKGQMKLILEVFSRSITTLNNLEKISTGEAFRAQRNLYKGSKPVGYPKDGLISINEKLAYHIKENDGMILFNSPIDKIIVEDKKVKGVYCNKKKYEFDIILSNILVQNLFSIIDEKHFSKDYVSELKNLPGTGSLCAYYSLSNINHDLIGKTYHFIEREVGLEGNDVVGMIDFMSSSKDSGLAPKNNYLVQSYVICSPEEAKNKSALNKLKKILDKNLLVLLPNYESDLNWSIYTSIWHLDGVAKTINNDKPKIKTDIENLYLVGDCVKAPGIGFNCALNSARILRDMLVDEQ